MTFFGNSEQMQAALRAVLAGIIVFLVGMTLRLEHVYWSMLTVLILVQPRARATYQKAVYRILGTTLGAVMGVMLMGLFAQEPWILFVVMGGIFFVLFYLMYGRLIPYSFLICGFTMFIVVGNALHDPRNAVPIAVYRFAEIMLGVLSTLLVTVWLWPQRAEDSLRSTLMQLAGVLRKAIDRHRAGAGEKELSRLHEQAMALTARIPELTDQQMMEQEFDREEQLLWQRAGHRWEMLALHVFAWLETPSAVVEPRTQEGEKEGLQRLVGILDEALASWERAPGRVPEAEVEALHTGVQGLLEKLEKQRSSNDILKFTTQQNLAYYRMLQAIQDAVRCLRETALPEERLRPPISLAKGMPGWLSLPDQLWADLRAPDPYRIKLATRTALFFMVLVFLGQGPRLSFMVQAAISALFILSQTSTVGASTHRGLMRLAGVVAGGATALFVLSVLTPFLNSLAFILVVLSVVMLVTSYISNGPPEYSYIGLQTGLAFFLTMFGGFAPPEILDPAVERFCGVLVGSTLAVMAIVFVWPAHSHVELSDRVKKVRDRLAGLFQRLRRRMESGQQEGDVAIAKELEECRRQLAETSAHVLQSRFEGLWDSSLGREQSLEVDRLRHVCELMKSLNDLPCVLHRLPPDSTIGQTLAGAMDVIEARLQGRPTLSPLREQDLLAAMRYSRREGVMSQWNAVDAAATGAGVELVGQILGAQGGAPIMALSIEAEPMA